MNCLPLSRTACAMASASSRVEARGLSQMTWIPAFRKAMAGAACLWFGVTMATASMPSSRAASAAAISSKEP